MKNRISPQRACQLLLAFGGLGWPAADAAAQVTFAPDEPLRASWYPDDPANSLRTYDLAADPDAVFLRAAIARQGRAFQPGVQANRHARANEARVMILPTFDLYRNYYSFTNWQLTDAVVFWGGQNPGGAISAPNGNIIDAAHRNGVKVYGNIFMAPGVYGGRLSRVEDLVRKDAGGNYVIADKLIEIAEYHGFDGWFFNEETEGADATLAAELREMVKAIKVKSGLDVVWYDAMTEEGPVRWQGAVNAANDAFVQHEGQAVADAVFVDFRWKRRDSQPRATGDYMESLGRDRYDAFMGIDTEAFRWDIDLLPRLFPDDPRGNPLPHGASLGIYRPEFTARWTGDLETYLREDDQFWQGANNNPADTSGSVGTKGWRGIAHYIPAKTPLVDDVFISHFNIGQGKRYFVDGELSNDREWVNIGLQDVLPTWRWRFETASSEPLKASWDFSDAFWGGSSIRIAGNLDTQTDLPLYMAKVPLHDDSKLQLAFKAGDAGGGGLYALIAFEGDESNPVAIPVGDAAGPGWQVASLGLGAYAGQTIASLGLRFADLGVPDYRINIGRLGVIRGEVDPVAPPSNPRFQRITFAEDGARASVRLLWDHSSDYARDASNEVYSYHVYRVNPDGTRAFVGGTSGNALFIDLRRQADERETVLEVEAVSREFGRSATAQTLVKWPTLSEFRTDSPAAGEANVIGPAAERAAGAHPSTTLHSTRFVVPGKGKN